jgi:hypothetical protein
VDDSSKAQLKTNSCALKCPFYFLAQLMFLADVQDKLASVFNAKILVNPNFFDNIAPVTKRDFLVRILTNLKRKYFQNRNFTQCLAIIEYLKVAKGASDSASEFRDAGLCFFALRRIGEATTSLDQYLLVSLLSGIPGRCFIRLSLVFVRYPRVLLCMFIIDRVPNAPSGGRAMLRWIM